MREVWKGLRKAQIFEEDFWKIGVFGGGFADGMVIDFISLLSVLELNFSIFVFFSITNLSQLFDWNILCW